MPFTFRLSRPFATVGIPWVTFSRHSRFSTGRRRRRRCGASATWADDRASQRRRVAAPAGSIRRPIGRRGTDGGYGTWRPPRSRAATTRDRIPQTSRRSLPIPDCKTVSKREVRLDAASPPEGSERPWWRRVFGGEPRLRVRGLQGGVCGRATDRGLCEALQPLALYPPSFSTRAPSGSSVLPT